MDATLLQVAYGLVVLSFALVTTLLGRELRALPGAWRWPAVGGLLLVTALLGIAFRESVIAVLIGNAAGAVASVLLIQAASALGGRRVRQWPWAVACIGMVIALWSGVIRVDANVRIETVNIVAVILYCALAWEFFGTRVESERIPMRIAGVSVLLVVFGYGWRAVSTLMHPVDSQSGYSATSLVLVYVFAGLFFASLSVILSIITSRRRLARLKALRSAAEDEQARAYADAMSDASTGLPSASYMRTTLASECRIAGLSGRVVSVGVIAVHDLPPDSLEAACRQLARSVRTRWPHSGSPFIIGMWERAHLMVVLPGSTAASTHLWAMNASSESMSEGLLISVMVLTLRPGELDAEFLARVDRVAQRVVTLPEVRLVD